MNTTDTKTHFSKETAEFSFENADVESICYYKQRMNTKLPLLSQCIKTKLCKPCTSFTYTARVDWCGIGHLELSLDSEQDGKLPTAVFKA